MERFRGSLQTEIPFRMEVEAAVGIGCSSNSGWIVGDSDTQSTAFELGCSVRYAECVFTFATKYQVIDALKRLKNWDHASCLLARAIYDHDGVWWLRDTYIGLILGNCRVYRLLNHALNLQELTIAALAARNALEMKVWISYVSGDETNARRLHDDQMVDARDLMVRINQLITLVPDDQRPKELDLALQDSQAILDAKGPEFGVGGDDRYLRTHAIAEQVGCGDEYKGMFPIISKIMHPTGLSMFLNHTGETGEHQTIQLCSVGIHYFANNIDALNAHLRKTGFPYIRESGERLEIST
jgi:hypothetical protein